MTADDATADDANHYRGILDHYRVGTEPGTTSVTQYRPRARMRAIDRVYPDGIPIRDTVAGANLVHLPTAKCDPRTTIHGAMRNALGVFDGRLHWIRDRVHEMLVDLLAIQREIQAGLFAIVDGTTAADAPNPPSLRPVIKDVMLASRDPVAVDTVVATMMGFDPMRIRCLELADADGLGCARAVDIEVVGQPEIADERWGFSPAARGGTLVDGALRLAPVKRLQDRLLRSRVGDALVLGSALVRDLQWPLRDRAVFEDWCRDTRWGRLFEHYRDHGVLGDGDAA